ncbi:MAG: adenosylmethionine decarboxylase [bacterium]
MEPLLRMYIIDYYECDREFLADPERLKELVLEAASLMGATVIDHTFYKFDGGGVSGTVTIAESHIAIHTWPEYGFAAVSVESCGNRINPWDSHSLFMERLKAKRSSEFKVDRGLFDVRPGSLHHKPI